MRTPVTVTAATVVLGAFYKNRTTVAERASGIAFTLPDARGTGNKFRIAIGTALTSGTLTVTASASAKMRGGVLVNDTGDSPATTVDFYPATAASTTIFTLTQSAGMGVAGDWVEFEDIKSGVWQVHGSIAGGADVTTPFS